ncbi:MAG: hypothetical protein RB191_04750 [Terriglobia bacterium]|nr:hypothetical protein [Terriglobia bacterium]
MQRANTSPFRNYIFALPRGVWALGLVCLFMDTSSELIHSLRAHVSRFVNDKQYTPKTQRSMLKTTKRNTLCRTGNETNLTIGGSEATTVDGLTAGDCVASYYKSNSDFHGWVMNPTMIVGTKSHYLLTCYYVTDSQDEATAKWVLTWAAKAKHVQQSLKIPAGER